MLPEHPEATAGPSVDEAGDVLDGATGIRLAQPYLVELGLEQLIILKAIIFGYLFDLTNLFDLEFRILLDSILDLLDHSGVRLEDVLRLLHHLLVGDDQVLAVSRQLYVAVLGTKILPCFIH
jgi:hypothetical protein